MQDKSVLDYAAKARKTTYTSFHFGGTDSTFSVLVAPINNTAFASIEEAMQDAISQYGADRLQYVEHGNEL